MAFGTKKRRTDGTFVNVLTTVGRWKFKIAAFHHEFFWYTRYTHDAEFVTLWRFIWAMTRARLLMIQTCAETRLPVLVMNDYTWTFCKFVFESRMSSDSFMMLLGMSSFKQSRSNRPSMLWAESWMIEVQVQDAGGTSKSLYSNAGSAWHQSVAQLGKCRYACEGWDSRRPFSAVSKRPSSTVYLCYLTRSGCLCIPSRLWLSFISLDK